MRNWLLFPALLVSGVVHAQTVAGVWKYEIPRNDGTSAISYLDLKQEGNKVTGSVVEHFHHTRLDNGTFAKGKLHATINPWRQIVTTYDGVLANDQIALTISRVSNPGEKASVSHAVAKPSSEAEIHPPSALPLPELHDVAYNGLVQTPPMGWNSWNHFAGRVSDDTIRAAADAIVASGMKDAGYIYVNIDDTWEGARDADGNITTNKKFPDMKALSDYVHSKGLKLGIYSSPGPYTCAGYEGSFGHEKQDAESYAKWGIDYLKYDWCSAGSIYQKSDMQAVYQKMGDALASTGRPIVYSLCQYGEQDVWTWGGKVDGNLWRTTGDIQDKWASMSEIGFAQIKIAPYVVAGHWNDPDMLEIGNGGMSGDEYRVHMTLWALLSAPLLAGNDLAKMSDDAKAILMNKELIAIDQDSAVKHPKVTSFANQSEIWTRELADGTTVVALFNRSDNAQPVKAVWSDLSVAKGSNARDLWKHSSVSLSGDFYTVTVPKHGVVLLRVGGQLAHKTKNRRWPVSAFQVLCSGNLVG